MVDLSSSALGNGTSTRFASAGIDGPAYLADTFSIGALGEVWVIDRIRVWGMPQPEWNALALYGGLAPVRLKAASFDSTGRASRNSDITITAVDNPLSGNGNNKLQQVDFLNLQWSIPAGVDVQFGIHGQAGNSVWKGYVYSAGEHRPMAVFSLDGKASHEYDVARNMRMFVQVWAHISIPANTSASLP